MSEDVAAKSKGEMIITTLLFEAGLQCPAKCFFLAHGERGSESGYASWARLRNETYEHEAIDRLKAARDQWTMRGEPT